MGHTINCGAMLTAAVPSFSKKVQFFAGSFA